MVSERSFGAVIFLRERKEILYLLLYRKGHDNHSEAWDFPRGQVDAGEMPEQTAIREIKEETGIDILEFSEGFREKVKWFYRKEGMLVNKEATYFLAETQNKDVKISSEHDSFKWCSYEDALKIIKFKNTKEVLKKANEFLTGNLNKFV